MRNDNVKRYVWSMLLGALLLWGLLRLVLGPYPQPLAYHQFADTRVLGPIPRAGDVLTNLAILAAGLFGWVQRRRMALAPDEEPAVNLLVAGTFLMAFGSAYYHWAPDNRGLMWDRLGMMLVIAPVFALVLADRVRPRFARDGLWPFTVFAVGSVLYWEWSETAGAGDLWLYGIVRVLPFSAIIALILKRLFEQPRPIGYGWLVAAIVCAGAFTAFEFLDRQIYAATGGIASGHNLKHVAVGLTLACLFTWLRARKPATPSPPG